jgi:hypothetical protein
MSVTQEVTGVSWFITSSEILNADVKGRMSFLLNGKWNETVAGGAAPLRSACIKGW